MTLHMAAWLGQYTDHENVGGRTEALWNLESTCATSLAKVNRNPVPTRSASKQRVIDLSCTKER